jgi:hypothetical protein
MREILEATPVNAIAGQPTVMFIKKAAHRAPLLFRFFRRPCERRDPYRAIYRFEDAV